MTQPRSRSRARSAAVVVVVVVAIAATVASGEVDEGPSSSGRDGGSGGGDVISYDPDGTGAGDVTGLALVEEAGATAAEVTITNSEDVAMSYTVTIAADSPDGSLRYGDTAVYVSGLGPGQSTIVTEIFVGAIPGDAVPVIKDVASVAAP